MITFNFSTIYTAILTCNILIAIIAIIIRNEKVLINAGYKLITIFLGLTAVRFLLPIEVPFATTVPLPQGISSLFVPLFTPLFTVAEIEITPILIIAIIWIAGILIQGYKYCKVNYALRNHILTFGINVSKDSRYTDIMNEICGKKASSLRIFEMPDLETPLIYGFFKPYILIPSKFSCTDKELTFILRHEVSHYLHHDLMIKFLMQLLNIIYWWNPFGYMLNHQMNLVLEMRIDDTVTGRNDKETIEYLQCLLHIAEYQETLYKSSMSNVISFTRGDGKVLTKRFQMLMQRKQKKNQVLNLLLICLVCSIYLFSYLVIFVGYNKPAILDKEVLNITELNSFIIDNGNNTYDVYLSGYKIETVDSIEYYSEDIPVYSREEYEHAQQEDPE